MTLKNDTRGVSEVVGAILVFGVLVALLAIMQTQAVPAANQQVEFEHSQDAQGDLVEFHQSASKVANSGDTQSVSIKTGTGYPTRLLFFNPPRVQGSLSTSENRTVTIQNAEATDPEVNDYLDGSNVTLDTRTFRYDVSYNELQNPPQVRYEYGVLYNQFRNDTTIQNPGSVIDDTSLNLVFMAGDYSRTSGDTQSLDVRPVSAPSRPVTIEGDGGDNITLVLPTDLPVEEWEDLYQSQSTVLDIREGPRNGTVQIDLDGTERYTIRMAGLGLEQGVQKPEAHYIVPAGDGVETAGVDQTTTVVYEVRDRFNNPVSGVDVDIDTPSGTVTETTDGSGRVTASVIPTAAKDYSITATMQTPACQPATSPKCNATYTVQAADISINPMSGVTYESATISNADFLDLLNTNNQTADITFQAQGSTSVPISAIRVNHYQDNDDTQPTDWAMSDGSSEVSGEVSGGFVDASSLESVETDGTTYTFGVAENGSGEDVNTDDFFVLTITFDNGQRATYFISPDS
jgi:hypothetical protein